MNHINCRRKKAVIDFTENGIHYHAEKGFAFADKNGQKLWSAMDVFQTTPPTKELVLKLNDFFVNQFDKAFNDSDNEDF